MKKSKRIILAGVVIIVGIIAVVAVLVYNELQSDPIELSETHGNLAFMSDREGNWDIILPDEEGVEHNLTSSGEAQDFFFSFTFSGELLNFYTTRTGEFGVAQVKTDGSDLKTMTTAETVMSIFMSGNFDMDPAWGPGGTQLAYISVRDLNPEIYVSNLADGEPQRITRDGGADGMIAWSPDGQHIAFTSDRGGKDQNVYVIDLETNETHQLTDSGNNFQPVWSLDGSQILFAAEGEEPLTSGKLDWYVISATGEDRHLLGADETFKGDPTYSPDGSQIAYMSNEEGSWHIYVMDADGTNIQRLTEGDSNNMFPTWQPIPAEDEAEAAEADEDA